MDLLHPPPKAVLVFPGDGVAIVGPEKVEAEMAARRGKLKQRWETGATGRSLPAPLLGPSPGPADRGFQRFLPTDGPGGGVGSELTSVPHHRKNLREDNGEAGATVGPTSFTSPEGLQLGALP